MSISKLLMMASVSAVVLALAGCSAESDGLNDWQPSTDAMRPATPSSAALSCIKGLIRDKAGPGTVRPITVSVGYIPDATGKIMPGMRDMVTSALSDVVLGSKAFQLNEIGVYGRAVGPTFGSRPDSTGSLLGISGIQVGGGFQIVGAVTQADARNADRQLTGGGAVRDNAAFSLSYANTISTVAVDLRLVDVSKGLNVAYSTRSLLRVRSRGLASDVAFKIGDFAGDVSYSDFKSEGAHQAVRALVELSIAELMGQAANVPYWACFGVNQQDPQVRSTIQGWWQRMSETDAIADIRVRLRAAGYKVPDAPKAASASILRYQAENGLVPTGKPSFETFASLVMRQMPPGTAPDALPSSATPVMQANQPDLSEGALPPVPMSMPVPPAAAPSRDVHTKVSDE